MRSRFTAPSWTNRAHRGGELECAMPPGPRTRRMRSSTALVICWSMLSIGTRGTSNLHIGCEGSARAPGITRRSALVLSPFAAVWHPIPRDVGGGIGIMHLRGGQGHSRQKETLADGISNGGPARKHGGSMRTSRLKSTRDEKDKSTVGLKYQESTPLLQGHVDTPKERRLCTAPSPCTPLNTRCSVSRALS
jgi:hypothetical protein